MEEEKKIESPIHLYNYFQLNYLKNWCFIRTYSSILANIAVKLVKRETNTLRDICLWLGDLLFSRDFYEHSFNFNSTDLSVLNI